MGRERERKRTRKRIVKLASGLANEKASNGQSGRSRPYLHFTRNENCIARATNDRSIVKLGMESIINPKTELCRLQTVRQLP